MLGHVLIVDDSKMDRFIVEKMVERSGLAARVVSKELARLGLEYIRNCMENDHDTPRVIFLDINMPELSGFDFLEAYKDFPPETVQNTSVVMLSSSLNEDDYEKAMSYDIVKMFCNKPISIARLEELDKMLQQSSAPELLEDEEADESFTAEEAIDQELQLDWEITDVFGLLEDEAEAEIRNEQKHREEPE